MAQERPSEKDEEKNAAKKEELFKQIDGSAATEAPPPLPLRLVPRGSGEISLAAVSRL